LFFPDGRSLSQDTLKRLEEIQSLLCCRLMDTEFGALLFATEFKLPDNVQQPLTWVEREYLMMADDPADDTPEGIVKRGEAIVKRWLVRFCVIPGLRRLRVRYRCGRAKARMWLHDYMHDEEARPNIRWLRAGHAEE